MASVKVPYKLIMPYLLCLLYLITCYTMLMGFAHPKCVSGASCRYLELPGATWSYLGLSGSVCRYLILSGAFWSYLELSVTICSYLQLPGAIWNYLELSGAIWSYLELSCRQLDLSGAIWSGRPNDSARGHRGLPCGARRSCRLHIRKDLIFK